MIGLRWWETWELPQPRALCFGLLQERDVWVGIFPQRKEILVGRARLGKGLQPFDCAMKVPIGTRFSRDCHNGNSGFHRIGTAQAQVG